MASRKPSTAGSSSEKAPHITSDEVREQAVATRTISKEGRGRLLAARGRSNVHERGTLEDRLSPDLYSRIQPYLIESVDGFHFLDWQKLKDDTDAWAADKLSLDDDDRLYCHCVDILYNAWASPDLPDSQVGDWHHLWPICVGGSECDARNIKKLCISNHVLVHACLVRVFDYMSHMGLNYALVATVNHRAISYETVEQLITDVVSPFPLLVVSLLSPHCICSAK